MLPTVDMIERALPEGVLDPGRRMSGFLYFEHLRKPSSSAPIPYNMRCTRSATDAEKLGGVLELNEVGGKQAARLAQQLCAWAYRQVGSAGGLPKQGARLRRSRK